MKKSETTAYLIAGVLATSVVLTGCGGGSGGGLSGLGAAGATGATGAAGGTGATGTTTGSLTNLLDVLGPSGIDVAGIVPGLEGVNLRALSSADVLDLEAAGFTGLDSVQLLESNGTILGINTPGGAFALPGITLPAGLPALPALPVNVGNIISGLRL
ncbi:hypothetical protein [Rickettsiella endosymbiont of Rhagonycha lignosa]|uniref:hypothetical protein n=1 Tax=Rickettsiella endosymbiont of Rhagonycha lignosa TaxID=3077937 RepID=UPI00313C042F